MGRVFIYSVSLWGKVCVTLVWLWNVPTPQSCLRRKERRIAALVQVMMVSRCCHQKWPSPLISLLQVTEHRLSCRDRR